MKLLFNKIRNRYKERKQVRLKTFLIMMCVMVCFTCCYNIYNTMFASAAVVENDDSYAGWNTVNVDTSWDIGHPSADGNNYWTSEIDPPEVMVIGVTPTTVLMGTMANTRINGSTTVHISHGNVITESVELTFPKISYRLGQSSPFIYKGLCLMIGTMTGKDYSYGSVGSSQLKFDTLIPKVMKTVSDELVNSQNDSTLNNVFKTLSTVGMAIFVILWLIYFVSSIVKERATPELAFKIILSLLLGYAIVANAKAFVMAFVNIALWVNNAISTSMSSIIDAYDSFFERQLLLAAAGSYRMVFGLRINLGLIEFGNKWGTLWLCVNVIPFIVLVIPFIAYLLCIFAVIKTLVKNMVEVLVRIYTAPIAIAMAAGDGMGSHSLIQWGKRTMAVALKPTVVCIVLACAGTIANVYEGIFHQGTILWELPAVLGLTLTFSTIKELCTNLNFEIA
jgi:hypothetical protein